MKKSIFGKIGAAAVVLTLVTSSLVGGTFAKYVTNANGTAAGTVAKWGVTFTDGGSGEYTGDNFEIKLNGENGETLITPGSSGNFDIVVNGSEAQVDFNYTITLAKGTGENLTEVKFYEGTGDSKKPIEGGELTGEIKATDATKTVTKTITWELPKGADDKADTALAGTDISYDISLKAEQIIEPVVE